MKQYAGIALEVIGAATVSYALTMLALWAGLLAAGVFLILIGAYVGSLK